MAAPYSVVFPMQSDQRKSKRRPVRYPAWIERDGNTPDECQLSDVSSSGARILVKSTEEVPEDFSLLLSSVGRSRRKCQVVWRAGNEVGLKFDKAKTVPPKPHRGKS